MNVTIHSACSLLVLVSYILGKLCVRFIHSLCESVVCASQHRAVFLIAGRPAVIYGSLTLLCLQGAESRGTMGGKQSLQKHGGALGF